MPNQPSDLKSFMNMLNKNRWCIVDTETTGLHDTAEIVQIAIVGAGACEIFNSYVKPTTPIFADAAAITGITNEKVADAPTWAEIAPELHQMLSNMDVITYGATFDRRLFHQSDRAAGLLETGWDGIALWYCAMTAFAERKGEWNNYRGSFTWKKLIEAMAYYDLPIQGAHDALGDAMMTLQLVKAMMNDPMCITAAVGS